MQYLLSVHFDESATPPSDEHMAQMYKDVDVVNQEIKDKGAWVFAGGLHPTNMATTVRYDNGDTIVTDGPYAETKEALGGFWIIEAPDLDVAIDWAQKGARACKGPIEVRPFQPEPEA